MNQTASAVEPVTVENCEREPIHIPGAIQPHGALLAYVEGRPEPLFWSANLARWWPGGDAAQAAAAVEGLRARAVAAGGLTSDGVLRHHVGTLRLADASDSLAALSVVTHVEKGMCIAELEAVDPDAHDWLALLGEMLAALRSIDTPIAWSREAAPRIRQMLGFDRVMVYRFDAEWNGQVIADARAADMESYLDLHYPASDIPPQARELYRTNLVRYIADVDYEPVPVIAAEPRSAPLDMSHTTLRSVSPMHLQYLRNMGVASTLTASILVEGRLWGLIAAHHRTPTRLSPRLRQACQALAISSGLMVQAATQRQRAATVADQLRLQRPILDAFSDPKRTSAAAVERSTAALLELVGATGGALCDGDLILPFGQWWSGDVGAAVVRQVRQTLQQQEDGVLAWDRLDPVLTLGAGDAATGCGVLAVRLSDQAQRLLMWIRPEWRRQVAWGGDPSKPGRIELDAAGRPLMLPRTSFARWEQIVQGRCRAWSDLDVDAARALKSLREVFAVRLALSETVRSERRFRDLVTLQSDSYWQADHEGRIVSLTKVVPGLASDVIGQTWVRALASRGDPPAVSTLAGALAAGHPFRDLHVPGRAADGQAFEIKLSGTPLLDDVGRRVGWHGTVSDTTVLASARASEAARIAAEQANLAKSRFLAQLSHELRTPLNAVLGFTQLLAMDPALSQPGYQERLSHIRKAGQWLLDMVSDLLDLSRVESGDLQLDLGDLDATAIVEEVTSLARPMADAASIKLSVVVHHRNAGVHADPIRLKQVLLNLVTNAIKYNRPNGSVRVDIRHDANVAHLLRIEVTDTGPGLDPRQQASLFQAFNRLGREAGSVQGTGIGLVIAKRLVDAMGGRIVVTSQTGVGSCFAVVLQRALRGESAAVTDWAAIEPPGPDDPAAVAPSLAPDAKEGPTVVCVEDDPVNVELVQAALSGSGLRLVHAASAAEGLRAARVHRPRVMLIDYNLPDRPGTWLVRELRADPALARTPCIAITADATQETYAALLEAGFDERWTKPLDLRDLADRTRALFVHEPHVEEPDGIAFDAPGLIDRLERLSPARLDQLDFGAVRMNQLGVTMAYNAYEARHAGLSPRQVLGRPFFAEIARCANNLEVAGRFDGAEELDVTIDYVFSFRLKVTPVRLRLLASPRHPHRYMLVRREN